MKHVKRFFTAFLTLSLGLMALTGCTVGEDTSSSGSSAASESASASVSASVSDAQSEGLTPEADATANMTLIGIALAGSAEAGDSLNGQAEELQSLLQDAGFSVEMAYAEGDGSTQSLQLNAMIEDECAILIVEAVNADAIDSALTSAGEAGISVLACGTLLDHSAVTCYVGTDYAAMGAAQAAYIVEALGLDAEDAGDETYTLELVAGDTDVDRLIYEGAMEVLETYLTAGQLTIPSGQQDYADVATADAAGRMETLLTTYYSGGENLDVLLTTSNETCAAALTTLHASYAGSVYPIVVGAQCGLESVQWLSDGFLAMTTLSPEVTYPEQVLAQIQLIRSGEAVEDCLTAGETVTGDNFLELLVDTGLYSVSISGEVTEGASQETEEEDSGDTGDAEEVPMVEYEAEDDLDGDASGDSSEGE
ncbi:MAG: substrate-binding domain-containing protein [Clostridiales bacterium]|nr:substrate-binding domain-containing protein [Clostridiales bacterium]